MDAITVNSKRIVRRIWGGQAVAETGNYDCNCIEFYADRTWATFDRQWVMIATGTWTDGIDRKPIESNDVSAMLGNFVG